MASISFTLCSLRRATPKLKGKGLICSQCVGHLGLSQAVKRKANSSWNSSRLNSTAATYNQASSLTSSGNKVGSPLGALSNTVRGEGYRSGSRFFPQQDDKVVGKWLVGSAISVFGIVVFGGLTRLTESGLSITEWRPVTGSLPPLSVADWDSEFSKYRASPEFKLLNPHMTLSEFKKIYYMEWTHRLWGRVVGLSFALPLVYFVARRRISARTALACTGIAGLIGFQGVLGWWMVKSGLKDDLFAPGSHPRVSQYRLVAHLSTAFLVYTSMLWNGLSIMRSHALLNKYEPARLVGYLSLFTSPALRTFRGSVLAMSLLVFITTMSGGLVAGLDAGLIYNDFPWMGTSLAPPKSELFSDFYSRRADGSDIWWRNMLENPSTVQLDHRILATTTFCSAIALWAYTRFVPAVKAALPAVAKKSTTRVVHLVLLQATLGISTLIYMVPVPLAALHQAGALAVLTGMVVLANKMHVPKGLLRVVHQRARMQRTVTPKAGLSKPGETTRMKQNVKTSPGSIEST